MGPGISSGIAGAGATHRRALTVGRPSVRAVGDALARAALIALGFSIPISIAVDGMLTAVIVVSWMMAGRFRQTLQTVRTNPVALIACLWFVVHVLGGLYSIGEGEDVARVTRKAATFLLIPIAITMLWNPRDREWAVRALMLAIGLTIVLSILRWAQVIPGDAPLLQETTYGASYVFKFHLTQNLLVAFGAFLFALQARKATTPAARYAWAAACGVAIVNVLVMGDGRIGQVVLIVLMLYFAAGCSSPRRVVTGLILIGVVTAAAYVLPETTLSKRALEATSEAWDWKSGTRSVKPSSIGKRLDYYRASARIVAEHPLFGVGTGGFPSAYEQQVTGTGLELTRNPHNEYLLRAVELGVPGVLLLLGLFVVVWQQASRLATSGETAIARGLVIAFAVTGLASSPLADHTEVLLFVWLVGVLFGGARPAVPDLPPRALASSGARASGST